MTPDTPLLPGSRHTLRCVTRDTVLDQLGRHLREVDERDAPAFDIAWYVSQGIALALTHPEWAAAAFRAFHCCQHNDEALIDVAEGVADDLPAQFPIAATS